MSRRLLIVAASVAGVVLLALIIWYASTRHQQAAPASQTAQEKPQAQTAPAVHSSASDVRIHAHNLLLRKGSEFRVYVRWLSGVLRRTRRSVVPSFDHPDSFDLSIEDGTIRANIGDIGNYLNASLHDSPLKNVALVADGPNLKLTGTVHKVVSLPVQVIASVAAAPNGQVLVHILKIDLLKIPLKGLLHVFHVSAADLVKTNVDGVQVKGNDILLDTYKLLPPPHIRGQLTRVSVTSPDIEAVFGKAAQDIERVELWRNFFSLDGGTLDFGSLSMHPVNLIMIDISSNPWFDLDLVNYRQQFASGYTRMTSDSGLQMFIPDRRDVRPAATAPSDSIQWFKDRNIPVPPQIVASIKH